MLDIVKKIESFICNNPGCKASFIASKLELSRKEVNSFIYGELKGKFVQDESFKWYPKGFDLSCDQAVKIRPASHRIGKVRGRSLFVVTETPSGIEIVYNDKHRFFTDCYARIEGESQGIVDLLLKSFSNVIENNYDQEEYFEGVVEEWGIILDRLIV